MPELLFINTFNLGLTELFIIILSFHLEGLDLLLNLISLVLAKGHHALDFPGVALGSDRLDVVQSVEYVRLDLL